MENRRLATEVGSLGAKRIDPLRPPRRCRCLEELFPDPARPAGGAFVEPGDVAGLRRLVESLADRPATVAEWAAALRPVPDFGDHAAAVRATTRFATRFSATKEK